MTTVSTPPGNLPVTQAVIAVNADGSSVGGGTQYTEDAAAAANPVGAALMLVREDARAGTLTTADGDNVAARGNNKGELYVKDTDTAALLTTQATYLDGLETAVAATNTLLTTQAGYLDGLETAIAATNTKLDLLVTEAQSTDPVVVSGGSYSDSADFTPAAASHVAGDCNGAAQEFTTMGLSAGRVMITSAELMIFGATAEVTAWRLYLYNITPPSAYADDTAWDILTGDRASFLGYVDLGTAVDLGGTQWVETHAIQKQVKLAGTSLFGYLVNLTTLTPAAVAHTVTLHAVGL